MSQAKLIESRTITPKATVKPQKANYQGASKKLMQYLATKLRDQI